jgi:hypothetical protein
LGVVALRRGRLREAERWFRLALEGHQALADQSGEAAAEFHLGVLAASRDEQEAARELLMNAATAAAGMADDIARVAVERRLARISAAEQTQPTDIVLEPELEPAVLEACRVLDRITRSGLCHAAVGNAPEASIGAGERLTEGRYWMTEVMRQQVLGEVIRDPSRGLKSLKEELRVIGQRVLKARASGAPTLRSVGRWAELAVLATDVRATADLLSSRCDELLGFNAREDPDRSGTALGWIQAAEPLEGLLKGELTAALDRARRQLDLFHRRRDDDQRYLRRFLERPQQIQAVMELLSESPSWALHFVGVGGTGKTMLMRYVSSVLGPRLGATTARVDFDYLNPDYPVRKPGLLLAELAEELRLNAEGKALSLFAEFDDQVLKLHEQSGTDQGSSAQADTKASFAEMLETFCKALAALPAPVILLIDTCEELAKIRPDGTSPEGVTETFRVLRTLHGKVPGLRVIFAGRRTLASRGYGWVAPGSDQLPARDYLRLHDIRGFDADEALRYLEMEGVPERLRPPILTQAKDRGDTDRFVWTDPTQAPPKVDRYNPFELSGWAVLARQRDGKELTPGDILSTDSDRYVELRILRRIRYDPLKLTLPAVALLGRFDPAVLRAAVPELPDFDRVFLELTQQEWIGRRGVNFYEMDEGLRRRLLTHYERIQPKDVELAYQGAAEHLEGRTLREPLSTLLPFHFDTAMRVLQRKPVDAALWWARAEARFADERQYEWARQLVEFMLGSDGACAEPDPSDPRSPPPSPLRAGVLATQLSCFVHTRGGIDRLAGWREVEALLQQFPEPMLAGRLRLRALAGKVAASLTPGVEPSPDDLVALVDAMPQVLPIGDPQVLASFVAAFEAIVERTEREPESGPWDDIAPATTRLAAMAAREQLPQLYAFAASLAGRVALFERRLVDARRWFEESLQGIRTDIDPVGQPWLDWLAPEDLLARLLLEYIRATYPALRGAEEVLRALPVALTEAPSTIDSERLAAAALTLRAAVEPVDPLSMVGPESLRIVEFTPTRNVHRAFPPLSTVVAEGLAALGRVDLAVRLLSTAGRGYEQSTTELDAVFDADRALLRIVRRMRLRDERRGLTSSLVDSTELEDRELLWSLDGLDGAKAIDPEAFRVVLEIPEAERDPTAWRHARWRTLYAPAWGIEVLIEFAQELRPPQHVSDRLSFSDFSAILDALEANELAARVGAARPFPEIGLLKLSPADWWRQYPDQPDHALRLILRHAAMADRIPRRASVPRDLLRRLGHRRAAGIAFDEGEMLALRLPERARPIVDSAEDWFSQSHDYVGAVLAQGVAALAMARLGLQDEVSNLSQNIAGDFDLLSLAPRWTELTEIAKTPSAAALENLDSEWRPWLVRLIACQAWGDRQGKATSSLQFLVDWIREHYGLLRQPVLKESPVPEVASAELAVPAELDGWMESKAQDGDRRPIRRGPLFLVDPLTFYRRRWRRIKELRRQGYSVVLPVTGFVLILALALAGAWGFARLWTGNSGVDAAFQAFLGLLTSILAIALLGRFTRNRPYVHIARNVPLLSRATAIWATVKVKAASPAIDDRTEMILETAGRMLAKGSVRPPDLNWPYGLLHTALPDALTTELSKLRSESGGKRRVVEVRLEQGLGAPCWEAMLTSTSIDEPADRSPLRVVRTLVGSHARPLVAWRDIKESLSVLSDLRQDEMATQGWRRLILSERYRHRIARFGDILSMGTAAGEVHLLHLVATPIDTASGPRLEFDRETGPQQRSRQSGPPRGRLLKAADVVDLFPGVVFCILQGTPQEHTIRSDAERRQGAVLRLMAESVFFHGVGAVVTIPTMPSSVAADVLDALVEAVSSRPRHPVEALVDAVRKAESRMVGPAATDESAFDLCLYATERNRKTARTPERTA